jgi:ABC-2 type transport system ATP-binding protein
VPAGPVTGPAAIRTVGLTKRYGSVTAVDGIELDVPPGDIYGFLGPNGSGKTTTVRMLLGLVLPTAGTVEVLGARIPKHARSVLHRVGALVEAPAAYGHLGARANLSIMDAAGPGGSRRTRRARIDQALEQVGLAGVGRRPVKAYSLGMRQRLGIAAALLRKPDLLILDEPTNGLDPRGIQEIRRLLLDLNASAGTTIFLSSHLLAEVEHLCKRVGVVDRGRLVLQDSLAALRAPTGSVVLRTPDPEWAVGVLDGDLRERSGDRLVVRATDPAELNARLVGHGIRITELTEQRRTLEEVVLAATTGSSDRVDAAVPPTVGPRAEVLSTGDSAWDRPPAGPPVPLPTRPARDTFSWPAGRDTPEPGPGWQPSRSEPARSEPARSEPARSEPARSEPARSEPARSEPARPEPARPEPARPAPDDRRPGQSQPGLGSQPSRSGSAQPPDGRSQPGPGWQPSPSDSAQPPDDAEVDPGGSAADRAGSDQPEARSEESA